MNLQAATVAGFQWPEKQWQRDVALLILCWQALNQSTFAVTGIAQFELRLKAADTASEPLPTHGFFCEVAICKKLG